MLSELQREAIQKNLNTILHIPASVTQKEYMELYNSIYSHCTEYSDNYLIKGEAVYNLLSETVEKFSENLQFSGSISSTAEQVRTFISTVDLLEKTFSYLERFYIRTSILNNKDVRKVKDLFFYKIYYQFIYKIENGLVNIIFFEIETLRKFYRQDFSDLAIVIEFYLLCLTNNGLVTNSINFYKRYVDEFKQSFNFNVEVGKLLKKIYFEMFFITTVINDRDVAREIIQTILFRKDEVLDYAFERIVNFEKFKHIYIIISMMPENCKNIFRRRYENFVWSVLSKIHSFDDLFSSYCKIVQQGILNKLSGFNEIVDECVKKSFLERPTREQVQIHKEMVEYIHNYIINMHYINDVYAQCSDSVELSTWCISGNIEGGRDNSSEFSTNTCRFFELFSLVFDDYLIDLYTQSTQVRLLKGMSPEREQEFVDSIADKIGWSSTSILKKSVMNFQNKMYCCFTLGGDPITVSCAKVVKSFWSVDKDDPSLHPTLNRIKMQVLELIEVPERYVLEFNFSLSPIIFELNGTKYKMCTSAVSLLLYIADNNGIEPDFLRTVANDRYFDKNVDFLIKNGFVSSNVDSDGMPKLYCINKHSANNIVDLFDVPRRQAEDSEAILPDTHHLHILEAKICRTMKKLKELTFDSLKSQIECEVSDLENAITSLVSKGYLVVENDVLMYVP
ncbi:uncharacterized protein VICG_01496 [Vittaforma corneae ATCC 50505]|uniref:Cullin family profile domain-containing protein n=1 Tax=Vittaforma corneae (strain ATCC 50505) TaxID=993615 RepID=L2GMH9_VITCO|nr:uncharacterized protein VICG_01496 [Vittaforma corneae ATCC 50505]ELA41512.1 hypothetical protein VICG_01496 [Vittaforma corneae ATCC 50505]